MTRVLRITDATTRLFTDGELEKWDSASVLTNWTATGSPTVAQSTDNVKEGVYSSRVQNTSTQAVRGVYQDITSELISGKTYYVRCWAYVATTGARLYAWDGGGTSNPVFVADVGTGWQQLIVAKTAASTGIRVGLVAYEASADVYFDLVQIATAHIEMVEGVQAQTFRITNWRGNIPGEKGGGIFQDSPIADGRELIDEYWENAIDTIEFNVRGATDQDSTITQFQDLLRLIQKAKQYGATTWQRDPVYVEAKADSETEYRYTRIITARIPSTEDIYHITFLQLAMLDMSLIFEHDHWMSLPPMQNKSVPIGASESYDGRDLGNYVSGADDYTAIERVYISNKFAIANLTDIYFYDDSSASFGSNLMDASPSFDLIPSTAAINDILYIGIDTSLADSGVFSNVVFRTSGTLSAGTAVWEYWNGSWVSLGATDYTSDGTRPFELDGDFLSILWSGKSAWTTTAINGITAYWIRLRFTATPTGTVQQVSQLIFSTTWPYIEVDSLAIQGDISALLKMMLKEKINSSAKVVMAGLRSVNRGENFRSYINIADEQNPSGVSVALGADTTFATSTIAPSGRVANYTPPGAGTNVTRATISFDSTIASHYSGKFHLYLRVITTAPSLTSYTIIVQTVASDIVYISQEAQATVTNSSTVGGKELDFGEVVLSPFNNVLNGREQSSGFEFRIQIQSVDSSTRLDLVDICLIPIDEWGGEFEAPVGVAALNLVDRSLVVDSISSQKSAIRAFTQTVDTDLIDSVYRVRTNGNAILQTGAKQRIWFRTAGNQVESWRDFGFTTMSILAKKVDRYLSLRGDR